MFEFYVLGHTKGHFTDPKRVNYCELILPASRECEESSKFVFCYTSWGFKAYRVMFPSFTWVWKASDVGLASSKCCLGSVCSTGMGHLGRRVSLSIDCSLQPKLREGMVTGMHLQIIGCQGLQKIIWPVVPAGWTGLFSPLFALSPHWYSLSLLLV